MITVMKIEDVNSDDVIFSQTSDLQALKPLIAMMINIQKMLETKC